MRHSKKPSQEYHPEKAFLYFRLLTFKSPANQELLRTEFISGSDINAYLSVRRVGQKLRRTIQNVICIFFALRFYFFVGEVIFKIHVFVDSAFRRQVNYARTNRFNELMVMSGH